MTAASLPYRRLAPRGYTVHRRSKRWTTKSTRNHHQHPSNHPEQPASVASFLIGTLAGTLGSLAGMGGGFVMIPLMTSVLRLNQHTAHGTSLFAVSATGLAGAMSYGDAVHWPQAVAIATTAMVTSRLGAQATVSLSETALKRALGYLMLAMAPAVPAKAYILKQRQPQNVDGNDNNNNDEGRAKDNKFIKPAAVSAWFQLIPAAGVGLASGYLSGLFGVGGGVIVVPALTVSFPDMTHREALATSLAAMCLPALLGTYTHYQAGNCSLAVAPFLAIGALTGAYLGGKISLETNEQVLQWGFCGLLTFLGARTLLRVK